MSVLTVIKKIGEKVLSVVEFPFKYGKQIDAVLSTAMKDTPQLKTAIVGLTQQFEAIEPDVLAAIAASGLNVADDIKAAVDFKSLFSYVQGTFFPAIEDTYKDVKADIEDSGADSSAGSSPAPAPAAVQHTGAPA